MKIAKIITLFLAALIIMGALAGCTSHKVLHDTDTLRVERDGRSLVVYDLAGDATYTLATKRVRKTEEPRSLVDTDTITITTTRDKVLMFHEVLKRLSDGKILRVTSDGDDRATPISSSLNMRQCTAEEWTLPN